ncbi:ICOS ligand-like [Centroberyx affinis]|uniref:ICOS ligand-like n=1 Tax=Centroberyx affinis TaxID=166261 RepID=UPI003A5BE4DF
MASLSALFHPINLRRMASLLFLLVKLEPAAVMALDANATVGESAVFRCHLNTSAPIDPARFRFHWQEERTRSVLFAFNKGRETTQYENESYRDRSKAVTQHMTSGDISVRLDNVTLGDDGTSFWAFATWFDENGTHEREDKKICLTTVHVAVPYQKPSLTVNREMMTAVCTTQGGFPAPCVTWNVQNLSDNSNYFLHSKQINTTAVGDAQHGVFVNSTINIPGGEHLALSCFIHNPTSNVTLTANHLLSKGKKQPGLSSGVAAGVAAGIVAAVLVLIAVGAVAAYFHKKRRGSYQNHVSTGNPGGSDGSRGPAAATYQTAINGAGAISLLNGNAPVVSVGGAKNNATATNGTTDVAEEQTKLLNTCAAVDSDKDQGEPSAAGGQDEQGQSDAL